MSRAIYSEFAEYGLHLPYYSHVSYRVWERFLDDLSVFMPAKFETFYFKDSGFTRSSRSVLRCALLAFGLMSPDGTPTPELKELVEADAETRPILLESTVRNAYARLASRLDLAHASRGQIREYLRSIGVTGGISRRNLAFVMAVASEGRIHLSPRIHEPSHAGHMQWTRLRKMSGHGTVRAAKRDMTWARALAERLRNFVSRRVR